MNKLKSLFTDFAPVIIIIAVILASWFFKNFDMATIVAWVKENWLGLIISYCVGLCVGKRSKKVAAVTVANDDDDDD